MYPVDILARNNNYSGTLLDVLLNDFLHAGAAINVANGQPIDTNGPIVFRSINIYYKVLML